MPRYVTNEGVEFESVALTDQQLTELGFRRAGTGVLQNGQKLSIPLTAMDSVQRSVAADAAMATDAKAAERKAYDASVSGLNAWRDKAPDEAAAADRKVSTDAASAEAARQRSIASLNSWRGA